MTHNHHSPGDACSITCPRCNEELLLADVLEHLTIAHPNLEVTR